MAKLLISLARHIDRSAKRQRKESLREERRRQQESKREAKLRQKDLERRMKESARLSAIEQARLEVEAFENEIDVLLSIHKEAVSPVDWQALASSLSPHAPPMLRVNEFDARLLATAETDVGVAGVASFDEARRLDEAEHAERHQAWLEEQRQAERERNLALRVLAADVTAYSEAITEFSGLREVKQLGSSFEVTAYNARLIECRLVVNGRDVIPRKVLSLTASGKTTTKEMPKARFHEVYQDHVCSCVLRVAREVMAVLPIDAVIVTASVPSQDPSTFLINAIPILSAAFSRAKIDELPFDTLDPSDAIEGCLRRGDVRASRKSGEFTPIVPLQPDEVQPTQQVVPSDLGSALAIARRVRGELNALRATFARNA